MGDISFGIYVSWATSATRLRFAVKTSRCFVTCDALWWESVTFVFGTSTVSFMTVSVANVFEHSIEEQCYSWIRNIKSNLVFSYLRDANTIIYFTLRVRD